MKKHILNSFLVLLLVLTSIVSFAQEEEEEKKKDKPVREPFSAATLIESQTTVTSRAKGLELIIHHRLGSIDNGISDLFGIYAASNIRLGLQYGVTEKLTVGIGTEKDNKLSDINGKYLILEQTRKGTIPVSVALHGNVSIDSRDEEVFGNDYEFIDRFSYFATAIVGRKFTDAFSLQFAPSYSHFNAVDTTYQNDKIGLMVGGRYKFTGTMAAMVEYHHPLAINPVRDYQAEIQPGIAFGLEIATITHAFQVFVSNYRGIMAQKNYVMNTRKFDSEGIVVGFNINVKF
jgi:hypothetical protein